MKFPGKLQFLHKNNKMPKYLMTQCLKIKMFFSVITKNLSWGISTKNLVTFKRRDGVEDEKF